MPSPISKWLRLALRSTYKSDVDGALILGESYTVEKRGTRFQAGRIAIATTATALDLAHFEADNTYPILLACKNLDTVNYVTMTRRAVGSAASVQTHRLYAGSIIVLPDVSIDSAYPSFTANTAAVNIEFVAIQLVLTDP